MQEPFSRHVAGTSTRWYLPGLDTSIRTTRPLLTRSQPVRLRTTMQNQVSKRGMAGVRGEAIRKGWHITQSLHRPRLHAWLISGTFTTQVMVT